MSHGFGNHTSKMQKGVVGSQYSSRTDPLSANPSSTHVEGCPAYPRKPESHFFMRLGVKECSHSQKLKESKEVK